MDEKQVGLGIPRNPTLYRLLSDVNIVEGLGTGFPRMFHAMRTAGLPDPRSEKAEQRIT